MDTIKPQVLVCQHGARRRYAVPRMLEQADMLAALYTDASAHSPLGRCATLLGGRAPETLQRLARREIHGIPRNKIFSSDTYHLHELGRRIMHLREKQGIHLFHQRHQQLSRKMKAWGAQQADVVYSMYHENLEFIRWAKTQGLRSIVDVFISPLTNQIMLDEHAEFPDWCSRPKDEDVRLEQDLWLQTAELADLLLCPSEWVAAGVRNLSPAAAEKVRIVPYGSSINYQGRINAPVPGRILFAGGDPLRKGLHYLAQATARLQPELPELEVRVAGALPDSVRNHPLCSNLHFLGKLSSEQMKQEFLSADCFVLPSLSEGFAGVVAEAVKAGCPVIVTEETGSPVQDGREGLLVPSRDVAALAEAIRRMVGDRDLRNQCALACREQGAFYSEAEWAKRLVAAIQEIDHA